MEQMHNCADVAKLMKLSKHTIQANPSAYGMYKIEGSWRISDQDLKKYIAERREKHNNVIRLALVNDKKESKNVIIKEERRLLHRYLNSKR